MASYQRVALFLIFDALEKDLTEYIRRIADSGPALVLSDDERDRASQRCRNSSDTDARLSDSDLIRFLDFGDKISILNRIKDEIESGLRKHWTSKQEKLAAAISVRNATMHGRPLTTEEYAMGFSLAQELLRSPGYWPTLNSVYTAFTKDPDKFITSSIRFLDEEIASETLNNLPVPDYDDTGFLPRPKLQDEIARKIRSRHHIICVLGDGGNGKTAVTLQTLYSMLGANDHPFDAIVWVSAKANKLTTNEISRIEGAISTSTGVFLEAANLLEPGESNPVERVQTLMRENAILLVVDNLETVLDDEIVKFVEDVPEGSKVVFTSRVPLDGALSIHVPEFTQDESVRFLRKLIDSYDVGTLRKLDQKKLAWYAARLSNKPLLLKWFAIGVSRGLDPNRIIANPKLALQFCLENVVGRLDDESHKVIDIMIAVPVSLSAPMIEHCGHLEPAQVEAGLSTLLRFGLIERVANHSDEVTFKIKPFARAYVLRTTKSKSADPQSVMQRYRSIEATYQHERGLQKRGSKYDGRFLLVRNRSEAVAAMRIKHALSLAQKGDLASSDEIFRDLLISCPSYFEVHRAMAYVAMKAGDTSEASDRYESALELEPESSQLKYFFGQFLMNSLGDYEGAASQFAQALVSDPAEMCVLREAIRVQFFLGDFEEAKDLIERAKQREFSGRKDIVTFTDLEGQLYTRQLEYAFINGDAIKAASIAKEFHAFLGKLKPSIVDRKMALHLWKSLPYLQALIQNCDSESAATVDSCMRLIEDLAGETNSMDLSEALLSSGENERFGHLKQEGLTERFGFIRDTFGRETYVARHSVNAVLWQDMCDGHPVKFKLIRFDDGKTRAENVVLVG